MSEQCDVKDKDFELMTDEELMRAVELTIHSKFKDLPATGKQKRFLKKLGVQFDKGISKSMAFFLIRQKVNGIRLPNDFV